VCWDNTEVKRQLGVLDSELSQHRYVCGSELSIADFSLAGMTTYFGATGFPSAQFPGIAAWIDRMDDLPAWRTTLVAPWVGAV
jgi:glutathione S-transferase